jgi:two-component system sensor histidine kinase DegS
MRRLSWHGRAATTEIGVSAADDHSLDELTKAAAKAILALENRLARLAAEAERQNAELNTRRAAAQRDREEKDIEYSLSVGSQYVLEAPGTEELRERERSLTAETIRAGGLQRQLSEFAALLGTSARRFGAEGELLGGDEATQAAIRSGAIAAQELERQRLAREIHDGPAQALANAIVALEFVERAIRSAAPGSAERPLGEVERIKTSLREGLTEIRRFIFDLRPTMLQDRGLALTVEHYIATYQSAFSMAVELHAPPVLPRLTAEQELTAFRIIQEAIQNARKHARATRAVVSIAQTGAHLAVSITDDGRGFSPERVTSHVMGGAGLRGMRERSALIGAELLIDSTLGHGTTVELQIPLVSSAATDGEDPQIRTRSMPASVNPDRRTQSAEVSTA